MEPRLSWNSLCATQTGLNFVVILLPQIPEHKNYKHKPPRPARVVSHQDQIRCPDISTGCPSSHSLGGLCQSKILKKFTRWDPSTGFQPAGVQADMSGISPDVPTPPHTSPASAHRPVPYLSHQGPFHSTSPQGFRILIRLTRWPW